jgi:hypothetical protein
MALFLRRQQRAASSLALDSLGPRRLHGGVLRRERRSLIGAREDLLRNLGGLMVEMYRRHDYRDELLSQACGEIVAIDDRVAEIDELLGARRGSQLCTCGAPILRGAHFCPNCGRDLVHGTAWANAREPEDREEP